MNTRQYLDGSVTVDNGEITEANINFLSLSDDFSVVDDECYVQMWLCNDKTVESDSIDCHCMALLKEDDIDFLICSLQKSLERMRKFKKQNS